MNRILHKIFLQFCCVLMLTLLPHIAPAGAEYEKAAPDRDLTELPLEELMEIEVATVYSASKFEQKLTEAPSSVSIITSDEIKMYGHRTLADILRSVRGFFITYDRNYAYLGVRGFGRQGDYNSRILLLVDGHRTNDNLYDSALIGTESIVDVDMIDRVEVVRGPGSSLYGGNAFFAVINVITKRGEDIGGTELSGEAGSFDSYKGRFTYGNSSKNGLQALVSGSIYDSRGQRLFFPEFADQAHNNGVTDHTDFDRFHNVLAKFSYGGFVLEGAYSSRTKGIPTASYDTDFNDSRNSTVDEGWFIDLKYERNLDIGVDLMGRLFYDSCEFEGNYVYGGMVQKDLGHGRWWGGETQVSTTLLDRNKIIAGLEYRDNYRQDQFSFNVTPYEPIVNDRRSSRVWAVYLQDEFSILKNLVLNAGMRYDNYSNFGSTINPRLALIYTPLEGTVFKILYGTAFRPPNVFEQYYQDSTTQLANPALSPEKIRTYELIYEQYFGKKYRGTASGFYYTIDDLIVSTTDPATSMDTYRNLNRAEAIGGEVELEGKWDNGLTGRVSYSYQDTWDSSTGQPLVNSPHNLAKINLTIPLIKDKVFVGLEEQFTGRRKTRDGNHAKAFFVTNLTLFSQNLLEKLELSASIYNLFDYRYGDPGGSIREHVQDMIQQDGRTFRVKLTYRF
jgi:outer membrane receptor for ferrienterochelin and colicins